MASINAQMVSVTRRIAHEGIGKTRDNKQQGYKFRGVDEVMNAFAPILADEGLYLRPRFTERDVTERAAKNGGALFYVTVKGEFDFTNDAGETVTVGPFYGEAMDSADKATNKAMAVAFKYAMFQTFCVPLEGVTGGDTDATTHEVVGPHQGWLDKLAGASTPDELKTIKAEMVETFAKKVPAPLIAAYNTRLGDVQQKAA